MGLPVGDYLIVKLMRKDSAHCGGCHSLVRGPKLCERKKASKQDCLHLFISALG